MVCALWVQRPVGCYFSTSTRATSERDSPRAQRGKRVKPGEGLLTRRSRT